MPKKKGLKDTTLVTGGVESRGEDLAFARTSTSPGGHWSALAGSCLCADPGLAVELWIIHHLEHLPLSEPATTSLDHTLPRTAAMDPHQGFQCSCTRVPGLAGWDRSMQIPELRKPPL